MEFGDFESWKICWKANLRFYKPISGKQACIVCNKEEDCPEGTRRSTFWSDGARCSAKHDQAEGHSRRSSYSGVCSKCDQEFVLEMVKGKHLCQAVGCRRVVRLEDSDIQRWFSNDPELVRLVLTTIFENQCWDSYQS
jgi:hypothetical protein